MMKNYIVRLFILGKAASGEWGLLALKVSRFFFAKGYILVLRKCILEAIWLHPCAIYSRTRGFVMEANRTLL
jgi:hypothetical protein